MQSCHDTFPLDMLPMGVILLDTRGNVRVSNQAATRLLGEVPQDRAWADIVRRCFVMSLEDVQGITLVNGRRVKVATASLPDHSGQLVVLTELADSQAASAQRPILYEEPVAVAKSSRDILALARRVAASEATVLVCGESGTGKEVLARYIHQHSARSQQLFVAINCAAIPENMLEATLFGYEKGAFTGAVSAMPGKFEQANGGTLLLDEISEMPLALQAKMLRVLQEKEVERLGSRRTVFLDVRVIATSNRDLREAVAKGHFREDLYFRLCVLPLQWKPLRERREDIMPLAHRLLLYHAGRQQREGIYFLPEAESVLLSYDFPGNVRELDNLVQRALIMQSEQAITAEDLCLDGFSISDNRVAGTHNFCHEAMAETAALGDISRLVQGVKSHEYQIIIDTLQTARGSRKTTAEQLGISPRTLRYKLAQMRDHGVAVDVAL